MNQQQKQPTRRSSRRNSIRLDHLPDAVRSKILLEFISQEALHGRGDIKSLLRLGEASKQWSQLVFRDTPQLWAKVGCQKMGLMTDKQLAALLRRTNAKEVLKKIDLRYCYGITGTGLDPLKGSTALNSINLNIGAIRPHKAKALEDAYKRVVPDLKAIVNFVETFPPFSTANVNAPGILEMELPGGSRGVGKKRWNGYRASLLALQKSFRKNFTTTVRGNPLPCTSCGKPMQYWLSTPDLSRMSVMTYCTKCHSFNGDYIGDDDDDYFEEHPDTGILQNCYSKGCKKEYNRDNFLVCSTCEEEEITTCMDCFKADPQTMAVCSMCEVANCAHCNGHHWYLYELGIHPCQGCKVVACGVCRKQSNCEGMNCSNDSRWFCSDCPGLKVCSRCEKMRCEENCLTSCGSCGDVFCSGSEYYDRYCLRELKSCVHCFRSFCRKDACTNVRKCSVNGCVMSVCDLCVADGKAKKMAKCKHCNKRVCDSSGCREVHRNGRCTRRFYDNYY